MFSSQRCKSNRVDGNQCTRLARGLGKYCKQHSKMPVGGINGIVKQLKIERVKKKKYKTLTGKTKELVRKYYKDQIELPPKSLEKLIWKDLEGYEIAQGYNRLVVGDHGAYLEFTEDQMKSETLKTKPGQEWRNSNKFVKYLHLITPGGMKVYHQVGRVKYADYVPGRYYINPKLVKFCYE